MAAWVGLVPPLLAALYAAWCGNLLGGVTAAGSTSALAALLLMLALFAGPWRDPLRLGRPWWLVPLGLWLVVAASAALSPVPRAGLAAVVLLPAYLSLPGAVARCWAGETARRLGARAMAAAIAALSAWALAAPPPLRGGALDAAVTGAPGAVQGAGPGFGVTLAPLGHHTLLAVWLATLLPVAALPLREKNRWRWLGAVAGTLDIAAVVAGRSLAGGAALACEALLTAIWFALPTASPTSPAGDPGGQDGSEGAIPNPGGRPAGRRRLVAGVLLLAGLTLAATQLPRVMRIASRHDASALARSVYIQAGWQGWRERPWLGWGPGSVPWTAAWFLAPRPGLNPWGEAVGELHSLPVHLAYETGALGLLCALGIAGVFLRRRWSERRAASDPWWLAAGCLGLAGACVAWLGTAALAVSALPLALAVAAGAALAGGAAAEGAAAATPRQVVAGLTPGGERPARTWAPQPRARDRRRLSLPASLYGLAAAAALVAPETARWHYDHAVTAGQAGHRQEAAAELGAAVGLDPGFPLYRMRLAFMPLGAAAGRAPSASLALRAAQDGRGVGLLWLVAGVLGRVDGEEWAPAALAQGCVLDPLAPLPPFYLMAAAPDAWRAPRLGARALMAEPRLLAATFWEGREPLFRRALEAVRSWPGVEAGWKLALLRAAPPPASRRGAIVRLGLTIDTAGFTQSTSLHLFRRLPWPTLWPLVDLRQGLLPRLGLPPATAVRGSEGPRFEGCGPGG
jgi:hypothetical protein